MAKSEFVIDRDNLEVVQTRIFDAPREKIFQIVTDPKFIPEWWGPRNTETAVDKMDVKVDGEWRYISKDDKGRTDAFHGKYLEIDPPEMILDTFNYEGIEGDHELVETLKLEDLGDDRTRATSTSKYKNIEDLDEMINTGMEEGATETWDRLEELLREVK